MVGTPAMMGLKKELLKFGQTTTIKGIRRVLMSESAIIRILWVIAVLAGLGVALYILSLLLIKFVSYDVVIHINDLKHKPAFPDITLCNLDPYSSSFVEDERIETLIMAMDEFQKIHTPANFTKYLTNISQNTLEEIFVSMTSPSTIFQNIYTSPTMRDDMAERNFIWDLKLYDWDYTWLEGYRWKKTKHFRPNLFLSPNYFICHTIHVPELLANNNKVRGLTMLVYINNFPHLTVPNFHLDLFQSLGVGVRLMIHPPDTLPNIKQGSSLSPGKEINVVLEADKRTRLGPPYGTCHAGDWLPNHTNKYKYRKAECLELVRQKQVIDKCGCISGELLFTHDQYLNYSMCNNITLHRAHGERKFTPQHFQEMVKMMACALDAQAEGSNASQCLQPCSQVYYARTVSQVDWPSLSHQFALYKHIINKSAVRDNFADTYESIMGPIQQLEMRNPIKGAFEEYPGQLKPEGAEESTMSTPTSAKPDVHFDNEQKRALEKLRSIKMISDNFLQINIMFESEQYTEMSDVPALNWETLLSNIGGCMNLWIGITFMTFIEVLELMYRLLVGEEPQRNRRQRSREESPVNKTVENGHSSRFGPVQRQSSHHM